MLNRTIGWAVSVRDIVLLFLFALVPVLDFVSINAAESGFSAVRSVYYMLISLVFSLFVYIFLRLCFKKRPADFYSIGAGLVLLVTLHSYLINGFVFDNFKPLFGIEPRIRYVLVLYALLAVTGVFLARAIARRGVAVSALLAAAFAIMLYQGISLGRTMIVLAEADRGQVDGVVAASTRPEDVPDRVWAAKPAASSPNVYYILPDMMIGAEFFPRYDLDMSIFDELKERGFVAVENARSNAPVTAYSLPHLFGMQYFLRHGETLTTRRIKEFGALSSKGNNVYAGFRERGYRILAVDDGYISGCGRGEDICIAKRAATYYRLQDVRFLERTPFLQALDVIDRKANIFRVAVNLWAYPRRMEVPEIMARLPDPETGPYFMYIHLGLPHYPFRFDADCTYRRFDDDDLAYSRQSRCALTMIKRLVDEIQHRDDDAIIIVQADHGVPPVRELKWKSIDELSDEEAHRGVSILSVFRLPVPCRKFLRPGLTPVNTFRVVFGCLDGRPPSLLEDRVFLVFYPSWPEGGKVREWRQD